MSPRVPRFAVLLLAVFALLLQGAVPPHQHLATEPTLFNHDHDLGAWATGPGALLPIGPDATPTWNSLEPPTLRAAAPRALASRRHADPRAPPSTESSSQS
jgi:hypothetical protein